MENRNRPKPFDFESNSFNQISVRGIAVVAVGYRAPARGFISFINRTERVKRVMREGGREGEKREGERGTDRERNSQRGEQVAKRGREELGLGLGLFGFFDFYWIWKFGSGSNVFRSETTNRPGLGFLKPNPTR